MTTIVYILGIFVLCSAVYFGIWFVRNCVGPELRSDIARLREHRRLRIASRR